MPADSFVFVQVYNGSFVVCNTTEADRTKTNAL